jgi:hypothetical protein
MAEYRGENTAINKIKSFLNSSIPCIYKSLTGDSKLHIAQCVN